MKALQSFPQSKLYQEFFAQNESFANKCLKKGLLYQTYWKGKYSENSCSFMDMGKKVSKCQVCAKLKDVFDITDEIFEGKYCMAISGDGQEYRRISTLHSSSLIALLCFYSISKDHPLTMDIEGEKVEFYKSRFEQKNSIGKDEAGNEHNSNMDIVLIGQNSAEESVILFLESKFSEYLKHRKYEGISRIYDDVYNELTANRQLQPIDGLNIVQGLDSWSISATPERPQAYCEGIKQMISHYQGIKKGFIGSDKDTFDKIYLGEILFKFGTKVDNNNEDFINYSGYYKDLAKRLNEINNDDQFKLLDESLTYQDVFKDFKLDDSVQKFYGIGKK